MKAKDDLRRVHITPDIVEGWQRYTFYDLEGVCICEARVRNSVAGAITERMSQDWLEAVSPLPVVAEPRLRLA
jgi:hypothetical protein